MPSARSLAVKIVSLAGGLLAFGTAAQSAEDVSTKAFSIFKQADCAPDNCGGVLFGEVPKNHRWEITSVSCYLANGNANGQVLYWYLTAFKAPDNQYGRIELRPQRLGVSGTNVTYNATEQGLIVAPAGASVSVSMTRDSTTPGGIPHQRCTIGGLDVKVR
jgi:hypothetical protein